MPPGSFGFVWPFGDRHSGWDRGLCLEETSSLEPSIFAPTVSGSAPERTAPSLPRAMLQGTSTKYYIKQTLNWEIHKYDSLYSLRGSKGQESRILIGPVSVRPGERAGNGPASHEADGSRSADCGPPSLGSNWFRSSRMLEPLLSTRIMYFRLQQGQPFAACVCVPANESSKSGSEKRDQAGMPYETG